MQSLEQGFTDELFEGLDSLGRVFGGMDPLFDHIQDFIRVMERMQQCELGREVRACRSGWVQFVQAGTAICGGVLTDAARRRAARQ